MAKQRLKTIKDAACLIGHKQAIMHTQPCINHESIMHAPSDNGLLARHLARTHGQHSGGDDRHANGHNSGENDEDSDNGEARGVAVVAGHDTQNDGAACHSHQGQGDGYTVQHLCVCVRACVRACVCACVCQEPIGCEGCILSQLRPLQDL